MFVLPDLPLFPGGVPETDPEDIVFNSEAFPETVFAAQVFSEQDDFLGAQPDVPFPIIPSSNPKAPGTPCAIPSYMDDTAMGTHGALSCTVDGAGEILPDDLDTARGMMDTWGTMDMWGMIDNGSEPQLGTRTVLDHNGGFTMGDVDVDVDVDVDIQGTLMMDIDVQGTQGMMMAIDVQLTPPDDLGECTELGISRRLSTNISASC